MRVDQYQYGRIFYSIYLRLKLSEATFWQLPLALAMFICIYKYNIVKIDA